MGSSKKKESKTKKVIDNNNNNDDGNIRDERFQIAQTHPQFQKLHTKKNNNENNKDVDGNLLESTTNAGNDAIDDRFKAIYTESRFAMGGDIGVKEGGVDKYGRKQKKKKKKKKKKIDDDDDDDDDEKKNDVTSDDNDSGDNKKEGDDEEELDHEIDGKKSNDGKEGEEEELDPESRIAYLTALSRGEIDCSSTDESSDEDGNDDNESSDDDDDRSAGSEDSIYGTAGILDPSNKNGKELELTYDQSKFMAVCNMDWTNVRAVDVLGVVSSFSPPGSVKFIHVYPSDFGLERMEKDKMFGPVGVWKKSGNNDNEEADGNGNGNDDKDIRSNDDDDDDDDDKSESSVDDQDDDSLNEQDDDEEALDDLDVELDKQYDHFQAHEDKQESDFDAEKLRAYEAAKLKYYFAVVEFTSYEAADVAYKELDGMEMGHSSTTMDFRSIPECDVENVIKGRTCRDKASVLPSNYVPPDFVVSALQQTAFKCTWEEGDKERERLLTQYGVGNAAWNAMAEGDDLRAYVASDISSNGEDSSDDEGKKKKGSNMRHLLGLDSSDDDLPGDANGKAEDDDSFFGGEDDSGGDDDDDEGFGSKSFSYTPGKVDLEDKIRTKLKEKAEGKEGGNVELTPWEKYQLKKKEKRKDRKQRAKESKMQFQGKIPIEESNDEKEKKKSENVTSNAPSSKEELDLLLAGDNDEEEAKDFHMRDLMRIDKNKSKKLRGSRKRKEDGIAMSASGVDFKIDKEDSRFAAVLEGDDGRFGIDRTDPQYKETPAMREILAEQTKRRKEKGRKRRKKENVVADVSVDAMGKSSGALALSSLVKSLKSKVAKN